MIRSANFALGTAVNRVAILAECAAAGRRIHSNLEEREYRTAFTTVSPLDSFAASLEVLHSRAGPWLRGAWPSGIFTSAALHSFGLHMTAPISLQAQESRASSFSASSSSFGKV